MPTKCYSCGKVSKGNMPTAKIEDQERPYCADCYWKLEKEYKQKKTCDECAHFSKDRCKKTGIHLIPVTIGYNTYFTQAEKCVSFSTDKEVILEEITKLELARRYEDAALEYEKLGMLDEAEQTRKKVLPIDINASVKALAEKGQTLTYYCCHCGAPLKIGAKSPQVQKTCKQCGGDLEVINLGKLINQHLS